MFRDSLLLAIGLSCLTILPCRAEDKPRFPGPGENGFLLPNGWTLSPAGKQIPLSDLPLNILPLADGQHVLVATSGYNKHELSLIDLRDLKVVDHKPVNQSWFGLALEPTADKIWWSGGGGDVLHTFLLKDHQLSRVGAAEPAPKRPVAGGEQHFKSGLALDLKNQKVYSLDVAAGTIHVLGLNDGQTIKTAKIGARPYDVVLSRISPLLYVSDWASRAVLTVDPVELRTVATIPVGEHPNQLAVHPKDDRIFVACSSSNCVPVIDSRRGVVTETIVTALFPRAPEGSTPDALAIAPDGKTLYVANADNNCVAVIDITVPGKSESKGFIPTGWYPTSVAVTPDGKQLLVGVGKGNQTRANPIPRQEPKPAYKDDGNPVRQGRPYPYIGTTLSGALSIVPIPDEKQLEAYTATTYRNCPYSDKILTNVPYPVKTAIPNRVGDQSPIEYVIYVIKENRTYDQVFGDMPQGNGDPSLVMFGEKVTPNHHKLAREFVLLDNLYCNGHVSRDGHPWSTMAYNTDYIARDWALTYSRGVGVPDTEKGELANAPSGYLWDACARAGLDYRSYGEYGRRVSQPDGSFKMDGAVPGLIGHMCPSFHAPLAKNKFPRDPESIQVFLNEYRAFEKNNSMSRFIVMSLGEDHTVGTTPGGHTPVACVASNDLALGQLVEAVSRSKLWPRTAIFVIEDDAQNGPDHVDAHRTVGLVISPYTKRHHVDSTQYATVSMIRTMELILGLPPLSQYDAAARPMFASFTDKADLTPYTAEKARIDVEAVNSKNAYGARRSAKMDFDDYDLADDFELNEILWRSIKGKDAPLPPAVRRAIAFRSAPVK
jgi:YVTN family beta-propeller protein